jgi:hypothetical protein
MELKLSMGEQRILDILVAANTEGKKSTRTSSLVSSYYRGRKRPDHARIVVVKITRDLERKTRGRKIQVCRTKQAGPNEIKCWVRSRP